MRRAERFTLERHPHASVKQPVLAIKRPGELPDRYLVDDPEQLFLEIINVLGPWLAQPGRLPEVKAGTELFDQFREVMTDLLAVEKEA